MANNKVVIEIDLSGEIVKITKELIESEKDSDKTYLPYNVPCSVSHSVYPDLETDKEAWKRIKKNKK